MYSGSDIVIVTWSKSFGGLPVKYTPANDHGPLFGRDVCLQKGYLSGTYKGYTLGPVYNEFGYNEHRVAITNRFLCTIFIDSSVKKFSYNEYLPTTSSFFCIFLLVVSRTCVLGEEWFMVTIM